MRILTIGNSFSQDATRYIESLSSSDIYVRNLYIPGCSLEMHCNNIRTGSKSYEYQKDGKKLYMTSIEKALSKRPWDVVTIQQVSHLSGIIESYFPYISDLIGFIKLKAPNAEILFHKTWPYAKGCLHNGFVNYDNDTKKMYDCINQTVQKICSQFCLDVINTADYIYYSYIKCLSDPLYRDMPLYRDGFHLSIPQGRYLAALCLHMHFYQKEGLNLNYLPKGMTFRQKDVLQSLAMQYYANNNIVNSSE